MDAFKLLNQHINVSHGTFEKLKLYHDLLLKWQKTINLVSNDTIGEAWTRHFLDSLQLINFIENKHAKIVDIGSGAGFPAILLAMMGYDNIHLIESDTRKTVFLKEVARITDTKVTIHNFRVEEMEMNDVNIITSRACASINDLLQLSEKFLSQNISRGTFCLFHKGKNYSIESEEAMKNWHYEMAVTPSIASSQSFIIKLSNVVKVNNGKARTS
jgi:16S rRNA (guanine527-N7)-methyltransferase